MGWRVGVRFPAGKRAFSLFYSVQTGPETHPFSYLISKGESFDMDNTAAK
jgi:hypothetical protein